MSEYRDSVSKNPGLNFNLYVEQLSRIAVQATVDNENAFTVGIFGSWGSGKTTLMRHIQEKLKSQEFLNNNGLNECKTIWFNPWKFDKKEALWNALIQTILVEIEAEIENDTNIDINEKHEKLKKIRKLAINIGIHAYDVTKEIFLGLIRKQIQEYTGVELPKEALNFSDNILPDSKIIELLNQHYQTVNRFEEDFKTIVKTYIGEKGKLVIFIDDLDRCLPENALTVLESLKLYLDQANCIFFIGLDKRVIEQAVNQRYKDTDIPITGKEYIEKMIQLNFFLPEKDSDMVKEVVKNTFQGYISIDDDIWNMIMIATKGNIRKTKQFLIAWDIIKNLASKLNIAKDDLPKLAKILLIQMNFPDLYDALPEYSYHLMKHLQGILTAYESNNSSGDSVSVRLSNYPKCRIFFENVHLITFIRGGKKNSNNKKTYEPDISDPEKLKILLSRLSQSGINT